MEREHMKRLSHVLVSLILIIAACTSLQTSGGELAIPSRWKLVSFAKTGVETPVVQDSTITMEFAEKGQIGGTGGCNSYGGEYEVQGKTLTIKVISSTLMACTDDQVMDQENPYFYTPTKKTGF